MRLIHESCFGVIPLIQKESEWYVLLILHQKGHHWAFPKGHSNPGETPLESAKRELKEETGLEIERLLQDIPLEETYQFYRRHETVQKTVQYFPALVKGTVVLQKEEIQDAKWVLLKEASQHLSFKESQGMCECLIQLLS